MPKRQKISGRRGKHNPSVSAGQRDFSLSTKDMLYITVDNDYSSYLKGHGPHNLYFLKHITLHGIVSHTMQQLKDNHVLNGAFIFSARGGNKRKSSNVSTDNGEYLTATNETNRQMATLNITILAMCIVKSRFLRIT